jgi:hypothetical protein
MTRVVNVVDDPTVRPLGGAGRGASPANFIGFTSGDVLKNVGAYEGETGPEDIAPTLGLLLGLDYRFRTPAAA